MIMAPIAKSAMPIGTTTPSPITMRATVGSTNPWSVATMMIDALDRASALIGPLKIEPQNNPTPGQGGGTGRRMAVNRDGAGAIRRTARNDSRRLADAFCGLLVQPSRQPRRAHRRASTSMRVTHPAYPGRKISYSLKNVLFWLNYL